MNIEGVIFDLDGTLIHTIEDIAGAANRMFKKHGLPTHGVPYYVKSIGNGAIKFIEKALTTDVDKEQLMAYVTEFKEIYSQNLHDKSRVYDGIPALLDELVNRGIQLSVLSNKPHHLTKIVSDYYLSDWPFNPVFGQREEVPRKPDPAAAIEIAKMMRLEPNRILFVGDSDNDILTAQAADMIPLGVSWGYGRLESILQNGQHIINNPRELLTLLD